MFLFVSRMAIYIMRAARCISSCAVDSGHHIFVELD